MAHVVSGHEQSSLIEPCLDLGIVPFAANAAEENTRDVRSTSQACPFQQLRNVGKVSMLLYVVANDRKLGSHKRELTRLDAMCNV